MHAEAKVAERWPKASAVKPPIDGPANSENCCTTPISPNLPAFSFLMDVSAKYARKRAIWKPRPETTRATIIMEVVRAMESSTFPAADTSSESRITGFRPRRSDA